MNHGENGATKGGPGPVCMDTSGGAALFREALLSLDTLLR